MKEEIQRFIKFIPSAEAMWLLKRKPNAFRLLTIIAEAARREEGLPDGLLKGEALIGNWADYGLTEQTYKTAKKLLVERGHILIVETNRTRKKLFESYWKVNEKVATDLTTPVTTTGTKVKLISTTVYDINLKEGNDRSNDRSNDSLTTDQRPTNDEQESKEGKESKEQQHPKPQNGACVVFPILQNFSDPSISQKDKAEICSTYDEETVTNAVLAITEKGFEPTVNLLVSLKAACKGGWKSSKPTEIDFQKNRNIAKALENKGHTFYTYVASVRGLEIIKGANGGSVFVTYEQKTEIFIKKVEVEAKTKLSMAEFRTETGLQGSNYNIAV